VGIPVAPTYNPHPLSFGEQPIMNVPGGIPTYFSPSLGLTLTFPGVGPSSASGVSALGFRPAGKVTRDNGLVTFSTGSGLNWEKYQLPTAIKVSATTAMATNLIFLGDSVFMGVFTGLYGGQARNRGIWPLGHRVMEELFLVICP